MTADDPARGLLAVAIALFARLAAATVVLWLYKTVAPGGFVPFALLMAGGFVVLYTYRRDPLLRLAEEAADRRRAPIEGGR